MKNGKLVALLLMLALMAPPLLAQEDDHGHDATAAGHHEDEQDGAHGHGDEDGHGHEENVAELTPQQLASAGIEVGVVRREEVAQIINAPGEVMLNAYRTSKVTPRIAAQVIRRHVRLGEQVRAGQAMATLSSVAMAEAPGDLLVADREWRRVKKLGRKVVSERRYIEAEVARQQAYARVRAYGMSEAQIRALLRKSDVSRATGEFKLTSPQAGTVILDDFIIGEFVEPGRVLFEVSDESRLWVQARLTPEAAAQVAIGARAWIQVGGRRLSGVVIQARHALDESTRTLALRIEVENPDDRLHPGQFVQAVLESDSHEAALAVPLEAVMRSPDGDWQLFVEEAPGRFKPQEVTVLRTVGKRMVIAGIEEGTRIVTRGAFFIQSEIAKGGFEIHNH
ncbi:MAG: efflux RND transporter periplasmic adaptor subunit [Gammaproteobacteria bacterium]